MQSHLFSDEAYFLYGHHVRANVNEVYFSTRSKLVSPCCCCWRWWGWRYYTDVLLAIILRCKHFQ